MQLKKLIKMYNEKFGDTLGVIDDDFNKEQMYRIYYFIKNNCNDKDIQDRLAKIKLDKPKTLEQQLTKLESENNKGTKDDVGNDKADILELKNIETISENLYSKKFLLVESKLSDIISFEQMRNSTVNANYKAPLFVCNINKSLDNLNDLDELFFSIKYKVGNEIKTGNMSVKIKYGTSVQIELSDAINYSGVKIKYGNMAIKVLPNKRCTNATTTIDDNSYCVLQVRILSGYISEEDINSIKNSVVSVYVRRRNYLTLDNSSEFTPTDKYQPATKKYVDNKFVIDELETVLTVPKSELDKCNDTGAGISPSQNLNVINPNDGKHIYYACYGDIINEITYTSDKLAGYTGTLCELEDGNVLDLCMTFSNNNLVACSTGLASVKNYVFTNDLIIKSKKILAIDEMATKEYVDDKVTVKILPVEYDNGKIVNVKNLEAHSTYRCPNDVDFLDLEYERESKLVAFLMTSNTEQLIYVGNKTDKQIELMIGVYSYVIHFKTETQAGSMERNVYYLTPNNNMAFIPTKDYNPVHKKYVDDKVSSLPQLSFNEAGELVVTINGVSKTFVPKAE